MHSLKRWIPPYLLAVFVLVLTLTLGKLANSAVADLPPVQSKPAAPVVTAAQIADPNRLHVVLDENARPLYKDWTLIGLIAGWVLALSQYVMNRADKRAEQTRQYLLDSLRWFSGESQPRSIGIAVIEASWESNAEMRPYWTRVLAVQAIHLLARSKDSDSRVEEANLDRIMTLLTRTDAVLSSRDRERLCRLLLQRGGGARVSSGGIDLTNLLEPLKTWTSHFCQNAQESGLCETGTETRLSEPT